MYNVLEYLSVFDVTHVCGMMYIYVAHAMFKLHLQWTCYILGYVNYNLVCENVHLCSPSKV
jgi:hypothetical protein